MLHLLLVASERGVLGLKLFHKSSAWKTTRHIFVSGLVLVQLKWHGTSRSRKKKQAEAKVTGLPACLECSLATFLERFFDCNYRNQALLYGRLRNRFMKPDRTRGSFLESLENFSGPLSQF